MGNNYDSNKKSPSDEVSEGDKLSEYEIHRLKMESDKEYRQILASAKTSTNNKNMIYGLVIVVLIVLIIRSGLSTNKLLNEKGTNTLNINIDNELNESANEPSNSIGNNNIEIIPNTESKSE